MMQTTVNDSGKTKTAERTQFAIKNMFTSEFDAVSVGQNCFSGYTQKPLMFEML